MNHQSLRLPQHSYQLDSCNYIHSPNAGTIEPVVIGFYMSRYPDYTKTQWINEIEPKYALLLGIIDSLQSLALFALYTWQVILILPGIGIPDCDVGFAI